MLFLYFCPFLDQQLNLCRQIPDFPHIGQIPGFSEPQVFCTLMDKSRVIFKITRFFKITTPGFFKIPNFSHIWTNPGLFSKSHVFSKSPIFSKSHVFSKSPFFQKPKFYKSPFLQKPGFFTPLTL